MSAAVVVSKRGSSTSDEGGDDGTNKKRKSKKLKSIASSKNSVASTKNNNNKNAFDFDVLIRSQTSGVDRQRAIDAEFDATFRSSDDVDASGAPVGAAPGSTTTLFTHAPTTTTTTAVDHDDDDQLDPYHASILRRMAVKTESSLRFPPAGYRLFCHDRFRCLLDVNDEMDVEGTPLFRRLSAAFRSGFAGVRSMMFPSQRSKTTTSAAASDSASRLDSFFFPDLPPDGDDGDKDAVLLLLLTSMMTRQCESASSPLSASPDFSYDDELTSSACSAVVDYLARDRHRGALSSAALMVAFRNLGAVFPPTPVFADAEIDALVSRLPLPARPDGSPSKKKMTMTTIQPEENVDQDDDAVLVEEKETAAGAGDDDAAAAADDVKRMEAGFLIRESLRHLTVAVRNSLQGRGDGAIDGRDAARHSVLMFYLLWDVGVSTDAELNMLVQDCMSASLRAAVASAADEEGRKQLSIICAPAHARDNGGGGSTQA